MKHRLAVASFACLLALGCHATTQHIHLTRSSLLSSPEESAARRGAAPMPREQTNASYDLSSESFELYEPSIEAGLERTALVWVGAGRSGAPPRAWAPVLDRRAVLWIGANDSGNDRSAADRIHLALDAAEYVRGLLAARQPRVYVGGFSGGARIASEAALLYPDAFAGGLFAGAADYFRFVRSSNPRWTAWAPTFPPPSSATLLRLARSRGRYVLLTGSRDSNRELLHDVHRAYLEDGFVGASLLEVADLGHELPPARCFEQALVELLSGEPGRLRRLTRRCS